VTYRTYADGSVVAYGRATSDDAPPEPDGASLARELPYHDWVVVLWDAHPLLVAHRARVVRYLIDNATFEQAMAVLNAWELHGETT